MQRLTLDCEESDAPEVIPWFCKTEGMVYNHTRKLRGRYLIAYTCNSCFTTVHPVDLVLAGKIIENKWNYGDKIW